VKAFQKIAAGFMKAVVVFELNSFFASLSHKISDTAAKLGDLKNDALRTMSGTTGESDDDEKWHWGFIRHGDCQDPPSGEHREVVELDFRFK
jgi:hypothetical protein